MGGKERGNGNVGGKEGENGKVKRRMEGEINRKPDLYICHRLLEIPNLLVSVCFLLL